MNAGDLLTRLPTYERVLDNGLKVIVRADRSAPVVAIVTHVAAGYFDEPEPIVGISHVLEHMYFKGTERRAAGDMARETKAAGGYLNAGTIYDRTSYYTVLPASALEQGLDIQADALLHSKIDEEELRRELGVIIQEAKRKLDNPEAVAQESLFEAMFDVHRMRRWRIGTEAALARLTRADVWSYYRNLYRPSNVILVIVGDVDAEHAFELVEREYGAMPPGEPVRSAGPEEPERASFRFREMAGDITQTYLEWGWRTPGPLHPDTAPLDVLAVVLGQGRASRLYRHVREAGLVTGISAYNYPPRTIGVFGISAVLVPDDAPEALAAVARIAGMLAEGDFVERELERARNIVEARVLRRLETADGQANLLADWEALGGWRLAREYLERTFATTVEDLRRVAGTYLTPDRATVLLYRPADVRGIGRDAATLREDLFRGNGPAASAPSDPVAAPAIVRSAGIAADRIEDGVHFYTVAGGARVIVKPRRSSPLVSLSLCRRGGAAAETEENAGITGLMARVSMKGTAQRTAAQLAEDTEALGGAITPSVGADMFEWRLGLPARHIARGAELLADAALAPIFADEEVERERKIALADLEHLRDDMYGFPLKLFMQEAFAGHPYGFGMDVVERSLRRLSARDLTAWHAQHVLEAPMALYIVGDVEPDEAVRDVTPLLDPVHVAAVADGLPAARWPAGPRNRVEQRDRTQTAFVLGFPGARRNDPAVDALRLLSNGISGLGGRLFEELRSKRSLAYSVTAYPIARLLGGAFVAYIATSPEREDEARAALLEELRRFPAGALGGDELERARRYTIGAWRIRGQTNAAQLADLVAAIELGRGLEELRDYERRIEAVDAAAIRAAAARCFDEGRLVEGVVRGNGGGR